MPRRDDIAKIALIGSGPIVIGQACEFDYSGTQALRVLREEGYETVLINSNPATIMTDPGWADRTYLEPLDLEGVRAVLEAERPDALLPTLGGQTALNLASLLAESGTLDELGIELIGASYDAIHCAEDRDLFARTMESIDLRVPRSAIAHTLDEARAALTGELALPVVIRPAFTLGGQGGGFATTPAQFDEIVQRGLRESPISQILLEESVAGWGEFELEVIRDRNDNVVVVCSIENVDPMGVHTGDSVTVAPAQTLTDREYQVLRDASAKVIRAVGVETGGSNVQFALNRDSGELVVIEMNPRVSRSSALASKATGYPIAKVATKLAVGYTLDEIPNDITGTTPASFEPALDYVVVKLPRFAFEKFPGADAELTTQMKSVGEAMGIGRSFCEAWGKAMRSRELDGVVRTQGSVAGGSWDRFDVIASRLLAGDSPQALADESKVHPWFLDEWSRVSDAERELAGAGEVADAAAWRRLKRLGISDARIAELTGGVERAVRRARRDAGVRPVYKAVDSCAAEVEAQAPYYYSAYEQEDELRRGDRESVVILGAGPNRIGQGIEFDYCCVQAAQTFRSLGYDAVMVNCNPETVSTDADSSDRLYFEPLTVEDVLEVIERERPIGVVAQFGGQTPLGLARRLEEEGVKLLGTPFEAIDVAEDRERFGSVLGDLGLQAPAWGIAADVDEAAAIAARVGYPVLVRPSYVLGGREMRICYDESMLRSRPVQACLADRPLRRGRDRGRRGCGLRRPAGLDRGRHAARRGGRRALGRLGLRDPDPVAGRRDRARDPRADARDRTGAGRARADQRAVRRAGVRRLRDRGEPAGLAHRAVRCQGHRPQPGGGGLPGRARASRRPGRGRARAHQREGRRAAVPAVLRSRPGTRARDALDRRGDGDRPGLPDRLRQGRARRRTAASREGPGVPVGSRLRQAGRNHAGRAAAVARLRSGRNHRHRPRAAADRHPRGDRPEGDRGVAERGRPDPGRRHQPGHQQPARPRCPHGRLRDP